MEHIIQPLIHPPIVALQVALQLKLIVLVNACLLGPNATTTILAKFGPRTLSLMLFQSQMLPWIQSCFNPQMAPSFQFPDLSFLVQMFIL
ncbi:conserved hypothetical protein [Ricinus communis]|uniref:Uncharacterized protein n=1 Tax=Ricinus communis TaxID=3988 RepID=B9RTV3_RICCO|nr:conserved hypothetical protein [Ricinus communis]